MSGIGAASFVEGLQGGIDARDKMDRNKQFKQMRKLGIAEKTNEMKGARNAQLADEMLQAKKGGFEFDQAAFDEEWPAFQQGQDPALLRMFKWGGGKLKGLFGGKGEEGSVTEQMDIASPEIASQTMIDSPIQQRGSFGDFNEIGAEGYGRQYAADGGIMSRQRYADGGSVDEERMRRSYGENYLTEEEAARRNSPGYDGPAYRARAVPGRQEVPTSGGGIREFGRDIARSAGSVFDDTIAGAEGGQKLIDAADAELDSAEGAREYGTAMRGTGAAALTSVAETTGGLLKDVFVDNPVTQGVAGFLGFDGQGGEQGIPTDVPSTPEGDAIGASVDDPKESDSAVADRAIDAATKESLENLDYKLLVDQGIRPEELPSMSTADWAGYRQRMTRGMAMQGMNPVEAHKVVDDRITQTQMVGFQREGQKAMLYLQSGQNREAAMALRQAYQYFPNGVSVKFGTMTDPKTGQPAIMTIGFDEETGEPSGSPMLITGERLTTMMENMSDPSAFRSWTKDGRDLQMEINKLQSVDDHRQGSLYISAANAETSRMSARSGGGMTNAERRQRDVMYQQEMEKKGVMEEGFEDPRLLESLRGAMIRLEMGTGLPPGIVVEEVMRAYRDSSTEGVQRLLEEQTGQ